MKVKSNFLLAERCHYHRPLRAFTAITAAGGATYCTAFALVLTCNTYILSVSAVMSDWKAFANKQKQRRTGKDKKKGEANKDELVVQRMSSEVSGKQQKYTRVGAQEYVPFQYDELSIQNIKNACRTDLVHRSRKITRAMF